MNIKNVLICLTLTGTGMGTALAEDTVLPESNKDTQYYDLRDDLRKEIASPITGQVLIESTMEVQQDFGGLSGNSTGMDGFPDAKGDRSDYPQNTDPSVESTTSQSGDDSTTFPRTGGR